MEVRVGAEGLQILRNDLGLGLLYGLLLDVEGPAAAACLLCVRVGEEETAADNLAHCIASCITCCTCTCTCNMHTHMHVCMCMCMIEIRARDRDRDRDRDMGQG